MIKGNAPALHLDPETRRALQLDALAAIPPMDRRDRLAELLTDASSLGSGQARGPSPTWDARGRCRELAGVGLAALGGPPSPKHR
jgi:hypothetical protein